MADIDTFSSGQNPFVNGDGGEHKPVKPCAKVGGSDLHMARSGVRFVGKLAFAFSQSAFRCSKGIGATTGGVGFEWLGCAAANCRFNSSCLIPGPLALLVPALRSLRRGASSAVVTSLADWPRLRSSSLMVFNSERHAAMMS